MKPLAITIACCTRDRPGELSRLVESILRARDHVRSIALELLIVDDGTLPDPFRQSLGERVRAAGIEWVYVNKHERAGLLRSRIEAARLARHDWLLFFDDDVEIEPDYLERFCESVGQLPGLSGIGGIDLLTPTVSSWRLFWRVAAGLEPLRLGQLSLSGFPAPMDRIRAVSRRFRSRRVYGCNMGFRRDALAGVRELPGFDGYSLYEDAYLSFEAARHGGLLIDPGLKVRHYHSPYARDSSAQVGRMSVLNHLQLMQLYGCSRWRVVAILYSILLLAGWSALTGFRHRAALKGRDLGFVRGQISALGILLGSLLD